MVMQQVQLCSKTQNAVSHVSTVFHLSIREKLRSLPALCFAATTASHSPFLLGRRYSLYRMCSRHKPTTMLLRATDARKQAHAAEPPGPGQAAPPVVDRRRKRLVPDALRQCPVTLVAGETEHAGRRIRGQPAALTPRTVGAAGEALLLPPRRRSAGGGEALVVRRLFHQPPPLDRAADERDNPLHAHVAMICPDPEQQRCWRFSSSNRASKRSSTLLDAEPT
jgi:hypothetical protein